MIKVRINKNRNLKEYEEIKESDSVNKAENRLYELHKEIQRLEQQKIKIQYKIKNEIEQFKRVQDKFKKPSQDDLFRYCNRLNATSKGKYEKNLKE
jgi:TPP-dependent pyruvate/acetoin dehydrogenase alpha subunit